MDAIMHIGNDIAFGIKPDGDEGRTPFPHFAA